ncbi:hypothetical protein KEM55_007340 [Ascosphaera atra]|nr:hypothetical protein KEM55_007340 [Ascosphaera atra]
MTMTRAAVDLDVDMTSPFQENVHDFNESPQVVSILNDDDNPSFTLPRARTPTMRHSASHSMSSTTGRAAYGGKSPRRQHRYHGGHQRHYHSRLSSPEISPLSLSEPDLYQLRRRHEAYYPSPLSLEPTRPEQQQPLQQQHEAFTWTPKQVVEPLVSSPAISSPILPSPPASVNI